MGIGIRGFRIYEFVGAKNFSPLYFTHFFRPYFFAHFFRPYILPIFFAHFFRPFISFPHNCTDTPRASNLSPLCHPRWGFISHTLFRLQGLTPPAYGMPPLRGWGITTKSHRGGITTKPRRGAIIQAGGVSPCTGCEPLHKTQLIPIRTP